VAEAIQLRGQGETAVEAVRRLEQEAKALAFHAAQAMRTDLALMQGRLADLSTLGSVPAGERDVYRQLAERIDTDLATISAISARAS
jgi:O6-methylguanine-DNA--protein-cysteine methyltransferase